MYSVDERTGELTLRQRVPSRGKVPRYFTFDPSGKWLIVSNQEGGNLAVGLFRITLVDHDDL